MTVDMDKLTRPFPPEVLKTRSGGGNRQFTYVSGDVYIRRINEATGNNWIMEINEVTQQEVVNDGKRSTLVTAQVSVTIPGHGTRAGIGVQMVAERGGEDLVKGAVTDALKNALKYFGVGLELYGDDVEGVLEEIEQLRETTRELMARAGWKTREDQLSIVTSATGKANPNLDAAGYRQVIALLEKQLSNESKES